MKLRINSLDQIKPQGRHYVLQEFSTEQQRTDGGVTFANSRIKVMLIRAVGDFERLPGEEEDMPCLFEVGQFVLVRMGTPIRTFSIGNDFLNLHHESDIVAVVDPEVID